MNQIEFATAISHKILTGIPTTFKKSCLNPPLEEEIHNRLEYGDKVRIKMSAYSDKEDGGMEYSPDRAEQDVVVGRANIPALNEHLDGMCEGEIRRVFFMGGWVLLCDR